MKLLNKLELLNNNIQGAKIQSQSATINNGSTSSAITVERGSIANLTLQGDEGSNTITQLTCNTLESDHITLSTDITPNITLHVTAADIQRMNVNILDIKQGSLIDSGAFNAADGNQVKVSNWNGSITSSGLCEITNLFVSKILGTHSPRLNADLIWIGNNILINLTKRSFNISWVNSWLKNTNGVGCFIPSAPETYFYPKERIEKYPLPIGIYIRPTE